MDRPKTLSKPRANLEQCLVGAVQFTGRSRREDLSDDRKNELLERAIEIAAAAHRGQADKAGEAYILHPLRVMLSMGDDPLGRMAAVLHDVVEDTDWTFERLAGEGFPPVVIAAVDAVTRRSGEGYDAFVARAAADPLGRQVKVADIRDNLRPERVARLPADPQRIERYYRALHLLQGNPVP